MVLEVLIQTTLMWTAIAVHKHSSVARIHYSSITGHIPNPDTPNTRREIKSEGQHRKLGIESRTVSSLWPKPAVLEKQLKLKI